MGVGPIKAIPKALAMAGISQEQVDLFEINEAFASQCLHVIRRLNLDESKVNVNGGAIALGHPLGCTGAKLAASLIYELRRRGGGIGVVSMCIGGGMGPPVCSKFTPINRLLVADHANALALTTRRAAPQRAPGEARVAKVTGFQVKPFPIQGEMNDVR